MQFEFLFRPRPLNQTDEDWLTVGRRHVRLRFVRHRKARRYVLRLCDDGAARVTLPRGGSVAEAKRFAERNGPWLERQLLRQAALPVRPAAWQAGTEILFRGQTARLEAGSNGETELIRFGGESVRVAEPSADLRPAIERHLWRLAARELPVRTLELAAWHHFTVRRVTVRNQRSRWGSCSRRASPSIGA